MSDTLENPVINLKLLIDEDKSKVVFVEAGKDFVDILFSFLTLPMGTIVRLIEMNQQLQSPGIGCFNNIYASVVSMSIKHFRTEACKQMLLYPGSLNHEKCQNLKMRIDDSEPTKCFMCPMFVRSGQCSKRYSNFNNSRCSCGNLMDEVLQFQGEGGGASVGNGVDHASFIITDDLKVEVTSVGLTLAVLKDLGYTDCNKLVERIQDVNIKEVATLLECLFTSDTPLTDTFLKKKSSYGMKRIHKMLTPGIHEDREESKADQMVTLNAHVRKKEGNILFVECGEDFVDLLFTFLAIPLESVWGIVSNGTILGCIGNLCRSFKELSVVDSGREAKSVLPHYYKCQKQLLDVVTTHKPPTYYSYVSFSVDHFREYSLSENSDKPVVYEWDKLVPVISLDPKCEGDSNTTDESTTPSGGFMKRGTKFMVTDDLIITPSNSTSTIGLLKEKQIRLDAVEVQVIIIKREEAIRLLEASLVTFSALSTSLLAVESASTSVPQS
ncbi:PREDICTED: uncharacterized protein LOC104771467 [Camelina sativa]|uniref:Uncharacterized protein LOC104771467 n=1 Tax=Camelina sativa TaxID=90675 RepID=A0ABM0Y240_CAMSA|nr:PREDICTED: uncharacterized protein LOC104771467 [Camelina sativa]